MYSVDLAAARYFSGRGIPYALLTHTGHRRVGDLTYKRLDGAGAYRDYQEIVFWGDFQQNPIWGVRGFAPRLARERRISIEEGLREWKRRFLLSDFPRAAGQKFYAIGTCFLGARAALEQVGLEAEEYLNLLARFSAILPRDEVSYRELSDLGLTNLVAGFDCASLLDHPRSNAPTQGRFAYAFGRTMEPETEKKVVEKIAQSLGLEAVPVAWLLGKYHFKNPSRLYAKALALLGGSEFLVTDIYHLAINALNLGGVVYCLGRDEDAFTDTCDDYKKSILMEMLGCKENYFALPETMLDPGHYVARSVIARRQAGASPSPGFQARKQDFKEALERLWITPEVGVERQQN